LGGYTKKDLFLAIDQGGHASRAFIYNSEGELAAEAEHTLETFRPRNGFVEHDARQLLASIKNSINDAISQVDNPQDLVSAGLATQRANIVCWDKKTGEALSPVISWQDTRGREQLKDLKPSAVEIHMKTGLFLSAHYGASKLRWCLDNLQEVKSALKKDQLCLGPMSSFLVWHLTQERPFVSDPVSASRTQLWNIRQNNWDDELLDLFGVPRSLLPDCVPNRYKFGSIDLNELSIPLNLVTGDQSAAIFAHGKLDPETAYINVGTGAFLSRPTGSSYVTGRRLLSSIVYQQDDEPQYVLEGTVNGAGSAVEWAEETFEIKKIWNKLPGWLKKVKKPPLFINGISGLAAPFWIPDFESEFVSEGDDRDKVVAVVESIVFLINSNITETSKHVPSPRLILITGGLSRLDGLCERLADLTRLQVHRPDETEATARGTGYLLAETPGSWPKKKKGKTFVPGTDRGIALRFRAWEEIMLKRMRKG